MIIIQKYVITEAFEQLSRKSKLNESIKSELIRLFRSKGFDVSRKDVLNYIDAAEEYIEIARDKIGKDYSVQDWYKETKANYPEDLRALKKDLDESKLTEAPEVTSVKDFAAKMRARKASQKNSVLNKINSQLDPSMSITDQLDVYFNELVPSQGPAETIAGELVRAMMRILYRDYNDGDLWYTGYGKETCGDSVIYIIEHIDDLFKDFERMSSHQLDDEEYTNALENAAGKLMVYLNEHPELFTTPLDKDSRSGGNLDSYFDLPTYEFDVDASYDEDYYDVSEDDIDDFVRSIVDSDLSSGRVNRWARDAWSIEDLEKDDYDTLEDNWMRWFEDFLSQYEKEDTYEDEEEYDEEQYEESLKEDTVKQGKKWVNKGDSGKTHGKFNTKKEADAQRRAMFANGYKG